MKVIRCNKKTEYFAIKDCIDKSIEYFLSNKKEYFVSVVASWGESGGLVSVQVVVRRELLSQNFGCDIIKYHEMAENDILRPFGKDEYLELWNLLVLNSPVDKDIDKCIDLSDDLYKKIRENGKEKN